MKYTRIEWLEEKYKKRITFFRMGIFSLSDMLTIVLYTRMASEFNLRNDVHGTLPFYYLSSAR